MLHTILSTRCSIKGFRESQITYHSHQENDDQEYSGRRLGTNKMDRWTKKDIVTLLNSINGLASFEETSRFTFAGRFTPSECIRKFNQLEEKAWTKEEEEKLLRRKDIILGSPREASLQFLRPIGSLQRHLRILDDGTRKTLFTPLDSVVIDQQESKKKNGVRLDDVIGLVSERQRLKAALMSGKNGILLFGPHGAGKKMVVKEVAQEACAELLIMTLPKSSSLWFDKRDPYVQEMFSLASKKMSSNAIILITEDCLSELSEEIIGNWESNKEVLLLACTTKPMNIDKNLLKLFPCRLFVDLPDTQTRYQMLDQILYEKEIKTSADVDLQIWSKITYGFSYIDLKHLLEAAATIRLNELEENEIDSINKGERSFNELELRSITKQDLTLTCDKVHVLSSLSEVNRLKTWNSKYGLPNGD